MEYVAGAVTAILAIVFGYALRGERPILSLPSFTRRNTLTAIRPKGKEEKDEAEEMMRGPKTGAR